MNEKLRNYATSTSELIDKINSLINRKLDFEQVGIVGASVYRQELLEVQLEAKAVIGENIFTELAASRGEIEGDDDYSEGMFIFANNNRVLSCELMDQLNNEIFESSRFINNKTEQSNYNDEAINNNNSRIEQIDRDLSSKQSQLKEAEKRLAENRNPEMVASLNEEISRINQDIETLTNDKQVLADQNTIANEEKAHILNGTGVPTTGFVEREKPERRTIDFDKTSEMYQTIEKGKNIFSRIDKALKRHAIFEEMGTVQVAVYQRELMDLQNEAKAILGDDVFARLAGSRNDMDDDEFAVGMFQYAVVNKKISQDTMDSLNSQIFESDRYFKNKTEEYNAIRESRDRDAEEVERLHSEIERLNSELSAAEERLANNRNPYMNSALQKRIDDIKKEIVDNTDKIDKLTGNIEHADNEMKDILNGKKPVKKEEKKKKEKVSDLDEEKIDSENPENIDEEKTDKEKSDEEEKDSDSLDSVDTVVPPELPPMDRPEELDSDEEPELGETEETPEEETSEEISDEEVPVIPRVRYNKPKITWKTILSTAIGIGIGATVFFTAGPLGVGIMSAAGVIGKKIINNKRKKLMELRSSGGAAIEQVSEPRPGIKGAIDKMKRYFNSEEGLRDMSWLINSAIITGTALSVGSAVQKIVSANSAPANIASPATTQTPPTEPVIDTSQPIATAQPVSSPYSDIVLGNEVGGYNVSVGHMNAGQAVSGMNTKTLASNLVTENSIFNRFAVVNTNGSLGQIIDTQGLSITDFCAQNGIDISQIAVDVARNDGASQAWISVSELVNGMGGPTL